MDLKIKRYLIKKMFDSENRVIAKKLKFAIPKEIIKNNEDLQFCKFGNKNRNKFFYVIQRKKGGGFFSNLLYVLNHLSISEKFNFIPAIDMENFEGYYNEKIKVNKTLNSWEYYFEQPKNFFLKEIYKSKNVIITSNKIYKNYKFRAFKKYKDIYRVYKKYIKIKKDIFNDVNKIVTKLNINKSNTVGLHWRGTDHKFLPNHPQPPTRKQIFQKLDKILQNKKITKIFMVTEDPNYLKIIKNKYGNKAIYLNSFRSSKPSDFSNYNRKNHRYKLGRESLIEVLILSKLNHLICSESNISDFAKFMSQNNNFKIERITNTRNSKNPLFSFLKWKVKSILPSNFGGY